MSTVDRHIGDTDGAIVANIDALSDDRGLLSQNMLSQLRNLVEGVAVRVHSGTGEREHNHAAIEAGLAHVRSNGRLSFLARFHRMLQPSASHYTFEGDGSERLMLKYYEHLYRLRTFVRDQFGMSVLHNLESFPLDQDHSLQEYHQKIAERIIAVRGLPTTGDSSSRYYVQKTRPFFVDGQIYYEVTFSNPTDRVSKFDRIIAFTDQDISDKYAARLTLRPDAIDVLGRTMPIIVIRSWAVSIRPCELNNFARFFGPRTNVGTGSTEYQRLMQYLTTTGSSLVELVDLPAASYVQIKTWATEQARSPRIFPILDNVREVVANRAPGHVVLRYLMLRMRNLWIRQQYAPEDCPRLSGLKLQWGCIPFDEMPFCTSLPKHNPRYWDLVEALDLTGRTHELLARRVKNNVDQRGMLYTPLSDLEPLGDVTALIRDHNTALYYKHRARCLDVDRGHVFVRGYENDVVDIIEKVQSFTTDGVPDWETDVDAWLDGLAEPLDDELKLRAMRTLFAESRVALVYGAAGTGKSTMVNHIAQYFEGGRMLFLANTHPAVDNLKRRVEVEADFRTIASHNWRTGGDPEYDLVVVDESSTVSNEDLLKMLAGTRFKQLVFVGDVYQIEAIQFGNWFGLLRSFVPQGSVFELMTPWRTTNEGLLGLWGKVRNVEDDIAEAMTRAGYSTVLSEQLFEPQREDEIILCLNYDGLYGINNINRFLQSSNPEQSVSWGPATYKVGDPIVFNDSDRFRPLIYNNLKGTIVGIHRELGRITFEVDLARDDVTEVSVWGTALTWVRDGVVSFDVFELASSDEDEEILNTTVPFQVAYAVSIHRAQGLEYESVKVVITEANEDDVTHSILYTAITRARDLLEIYWTPETQQAVLSKLERKTNKKDVQLLTGRRGLTTSV
ncbi:ATP-dependent RecD-like DNA helicase [Agromyces endophyticus]|uniref:ATP-dependent DNA helicase n=1 Tax=Agromyces sp. H17E-10 TaxID=2932244 RepID=UPI001FD21C23|nr:ATP-dependent RecD-like DNA helicase [Agromyces sp. H17E-10]UOQ89473.1 ATP-dependent RecD-like DNA helicase [Agromyces sp. H17E-10]